MSANFQRALKKVLVICSSNRSKKIKAISDLQRQVKYTLIPSQKDESGKVIEQKCSYIADFVYRQNGQTVVENVKGYRKGGAYAVFAIKRKLMLQKYGIRVKEV